MTGFSLLKINVLLWPLLGFTGFMVVFNSALECNSRSLLSTIIINSSPMNFIALVHSGALGLTGVHWGSLRVQACQGIVRAQARQGIPRVPTVARGRLIGGLWLYI
jgi:hypothetical protein